MLLQLHIGNAVHQKSTDSVRPFEHCNAVPSLVQLIRYCKTGGTASYNCHLFTCPYLGRLRICIAFRISVFNDGIFILFGGYRLSNQSTGTCCLTKRRAYSGCKFRKTVGLFQAVICLFPIARIYQIIPLRHQIVQRTSAGHTTKGHT